MCIRDSRQTYRDFELLILDDASTDETPAVCASLDDPRIHCVRHPRNLGMTANWNKGFELARGRFVSLLHDDDQWESRFLERTVEVLERHPEVGFVYSGSEQMGLGDQDL